MKATDLGALEKSLLGFGYERVEAVEQAGQWTRRGGILDMFPGDAALPFRMDFFGDDIESIRPFDVETQRSVGKVRGADRSPPCAKFRWKTPPSPRAVARLRKELPGRITALKKANLDDRGEEHAEQLEERVEGDSAQLQAGTYFDSMEYYLPYLYPDDTVCALDYAPADALIILDEPSQAQARWEQRETEIAEILEARAARGEYLTPDIPHACGFGTVAQRVTASPTLSSGGGSVLLSLLNRALDGVQIDPDDPDAVRGDGELRRTAARLLRGRGRLAGRAVPLRHRHRAGRADAPDSGRA